MAIVTWIGRGRGVGKAAAKDIAVIYVRFLAPGTPQDLCDSRLLVLAPTRDDLRVATCVANELWILNT